MTPNKQWKKLGWRHPVWDLVRYYLSLGKRRKEQAAWLEELQRANKMKVGDSVEFPIDPENVRLFFDYLKQRDEDFAHIYGKLRTEDAAIKACTDRGFLVGYTKTKSQAHHQSAKAVVSLVSGIAGKVCQARGIGFDFNPQSRCVCTENRLHVTARNIDGAIPSLANPIIIWEDKEYWGGTSGGSKMSDAVYECNLVGRELREFEEETHVKVVHIVFVDGLIQWTTRKSDLKRFVDLTNQGFIDILLAGEEIESQFETILAALLTKRK